MTNEQPSRLSSSEAVRLLSEIDLFRQLDEALLTHLAPELELVRLGGQKTLMREGDPGDCMYAVISGRLYAYVDSPEGRNILVGEIGSGESVGEMALLTGEDRSATVRTARDSELVRISREGFERVVRSHPEAMTQLARVVVNRLRKYMQSKGPIRSPKTIAVLPAGTGSPVGTAGEMLQRALEANGPVLHLTSQRLDRLLGEGASLREVDGGDDADGGIVRWLGSQESLFRFVLYEADAEMTPWSRRCARQADRILLVGAGEGSPDLNDVERMLLHDEESPGKELVLVHEEDVSVFPGTSAWLGSRPVVRHHHVHRNSPGDFDRLARFLAGRALGLVLGGGGARGFAHIGVIRALEEAGVPIDTIGGVSMGAIIAAQYAMGWSHERILQKNREGLSESRITRDFTLPMISLNSGKRFNRALERFYGETCIEDLKLNYFCVSCNLSTAEQVVHNRGLLRRAVRASNAVPILLSPSVRHGQLLVDGGILNNEPGDIMKTTCGGPVIVVNVSPASEMTVDPALREMPSPWRVLFHRLNPFRPSIQVPTIPAVMMRTIMVSSRRKAREVEQEADFHLQPPIHRFRMDDYSRIEEIAEEGYRYATEKINEWRKQGRI